jgi:hypothetical protein
VGTRATESRAGEGTFSATGMMSARSSENQETWRTSRVLQLQRSTVRSIFWVGGRWTMEIGIIRIVRSKVLVGVSALIFRIGLATEPSPAWLFRFHAPLP